MSAASAVAEPALRVISRPRDELSDLDRSDLAQRRLPTRAEVRAVIPDHCFEVSTGRSLLHLALSLALTAVPVVLAARFLPLTWAWAPVWILYALVTGTAGIGLWVLAHECGHGAFSKNRWIQDGVGYVIHTAMLVPYYSWQRSHAVHHAKTNHLTQGETHVPRTTATRGYSSKVGFRQRLGRAPYALISILKMLVLGWPAYLLFGTTGGPERGRTNHFVPHGPFASDLFPARWYRRVWASAAGVLAVHVALVAWAFSAGSIAPVIAFYVGPLLVVNAWLVAYTWLQHSDHDIPHFDHEDWSWLKGAFQTVDRPYGPVVDLLHHRIGSTHVAHHIDHRIPHYRADEATSAIAAAFPEWYRHDPTPVPKALWRVAGDCLAVEDGPDGWYYTMQ
ncbi:MAG: fatty acid desaturase [Acidimicrobiales bacterium]|nr:fatty acid desaturase [Acidimicrobiales bacterium]